MALIPHGSASHCMRQAPCTPKNYYNPKITHPRGRNFQEFSDTLCILHVFCEPINMEKYSGNFIRKVGIHGKFHEFLRNLSEVERISQDFMIPKSRPSARSTIPSDLVRSQGGAPGRVTRTVGSPARLSRQRRGRRGVPTVPTRVAPAASAKGASGACAAKVRVAVDGPRGGALPG